MLVAVKHNKSETVTGQKNSVEAEKPENKEKEVARSH